MKKIFLALLVLINTSLCTFAGEITLETEYQRSIYQKKIMQMGFKILNANKIKKRMSFHYISTGSNANKPNASASIEGRTIEVYKGILPYFNDDEAQLAGILSHEIAHCVDSHNGGYSKFISFIFSPKKHEKIADLKSVDYMVNAGYSPIAMIVILNKIADENFWWECFLKHPHTSKRLAYMYEYIYRKYPEYLINNEYEQNIYYHNFLITSEKDRMKIRNKYRKRKL